MPDVLGALDVLLDRLVIGDVAGEPSQRGTMYGDFAFARAESILRADVDEGLRKRFELRLRLAMHLAPREAINYDRGNPTPRWRLVLNHLTTVFGRDGEQAEPLAREVALVLDNWERERAEVTRHRDFLVRRDGPCCASCRVNLLADSPSTLEARDEFKPYYLSPDELLSIEVDHVEAISTFGTNFLENLQILCRLCNSGKSDGRGIEALVEARYAGTPTADVPIAHRARMLYYVIERDSRSCQLCGYPDRELTIRPLAPNGGYLRSNLQAVCVDCV